MLALLADPHDRYQALTGRSLHACPVCSAGVITKTAQDPVLWRNPLQRRDWGVAFHIPPVAYRTSGTLAQTQSRLAVNRMAVTRNTQCSPSVAAIAPPESGPSDCPRNMADAVTP